MKYFNRLGLNKEPFSNSPDPAFLYDSKQHLFCLQQLEISVRLKRGLNVVIGDIGTGKTTLCRRFVDNMNEDGVAVHLLLDPYFKTPEEFLRVLYSMIVGRDAAPDLGLWELKELVKKRLFRQGVRESRLNLLVIDEGQKMTPDCIELLRELLNYETNSEKLLQIVIFAQSELEPVMQTMPNFVDRINFFCRLSPLGIFETASLIRHRLDLAGPEGGKLFSSGACTRVYMATGGYPRKIVRLCHKAVLELIIADRKRATWSHVSDCIRKEQGRRKSRTARFALATVAILFACAGWFSFSDFRIEPIIEQVMGGYVEVADKSSLRRAVTALPKEELQAVEVQSSLQQAAKGNRIPAELGQVRISFKESLSSLIKNIYGVYDAKNLERIAAANPQIKDINDLEVGMAINFPCIRFDNGDLADRLVWLKLDDAETLSGAYAALRRFEYFQHPVRILPYWSADQGLRFAVVGEDAYVATENARRAMAELPLPLRKRTRLLTFASNNAVLLGQLDSAARRLALAAPR